MQTPQPVAVEVLGVVEHQRDSSLAEPGREQIYFTDAYLGNGIAGSWAIRTAGDPAQLAGPVHTAIAHVDPKLLIGEMKPMSALIEKAQAATRFQLLLIGVFAAIAAPRGRRTLWRALHRRAPTHLRDWLAHGSRRGPAKIFGLIVGHGMTLSALGVGAGIVAAAALTRVLESMLVGVRPTDLPTFVAIAALFLAIAAVASWLPARRAAGLDPTVALRDE